MKFHKKGRQKRSSIVSPPKTHDGDFPDSARMPARVRDGWVTCGYVALRGAHAPVMWQNTYPATEDHVTLAGMCRSSEQLGLAQHTPRLGVQGYPRYVWLLQLVEWADKS